MKFKKVITYITIFYHIYNNLIITQDNPLDSVATIFAPGFGTSPDAELLKKYSLSFSSSSNVIPVYFSDSKLPKGSFDRIIFKSLQICKVHKGFNRETNLGGKQDIIDIEKTIAQHCLSKIPIILFGYCKGATSIIKYVAERNPKNVQALILITPCADMLKAKDAYNSKIGIPKPFDKIIFNICFPSYSIQTVPPIISIKKIENKELPILILHSEDDLYIPFSESLSLYKSLINYGFKNVFLATLKGSHFDQIAKDSTTYLTAIHTFYKYFNFSYNPDYATNSVNNYSLDIITVENKIAEQKLKQDKQLYETKKKIFKTLTNLFKAT